MDWKFECKDCGAEIQKQWITVDVSNIIATGYFEGHVVSEEKVCNDAGVFCGKECLLNYFGYNS